MMELSRKLPFLSLQTNKKLSLFPKKKNLKKSNQLKKTSPSLKKINQEKGNMIDLTGAETIIEKGEIYKEKDQKGEKDQKERKEEKEKKEEKEGTTMEDAEAGIIVMEEKKDPTDQSIRKKRLNKQISLRKTEKRM